VHATGSLPMFLAIDASLVRASFRSIEALYRLLHCGSMKVDPLLFGRLNWKLGFLV
jgi:hypothetical protein